MMCYLIATCRLSAWYSVWQGNRRDLRTSLFRLTGQLSISGRDSGSISHTEAAGTAKTSVHHKGVSYCARATCDSESVVRRALSSRPGRPRFARSGRLRQSVENMLGQEFRSGVAALELRHVVEIAVVEWHQHRLSALWARPMSTNNSTVIESTRTHLSSWLPHSLTDRSIALANSRAESCQVGS